jgi:hypothetical protein
MNRQDPFNAFKFYHDLFTHDQIQPVTAVEPQTLVFDREVDLTTEVDAAQMEFVAQTFLVCRFQQSRSQVTMNFDCCTDDRAGAQVFAVLVFSVTLW